MQTEFQGNNKLIVGNGAGVSIKSISHSIFSTNNHVFHLNNILHIPAITINLLSDLSSLKIMEFLLNFILVLVL